MFSSRRSRLGALVSIILSLMTSLARAQTPGPAFVFTEVPPEPATSKARVDIGTALPDRGLSLVQDGRFDPGVAVDVQVGHALDIRSVSSTVDMLDRGRPVGNFQQMEILRSVRAGESWSLAYGGGIRQEWGGAQSLVARMAASVGVGSSTIAGNLVVEKALSVGHDSADVVTSVGMTRPLSPHLAFGIEAVGRDLEGFWEREEREGGARLLVGPSLHVGSRFSRWRASVIGGPMATSTSTSTPDTVGTSTRSGYFAVLTSVTYITGGDH